MRTRTPAAMLATGVIAVLGVSGCGDNDADPLGAPTTEPSTGSTAAPTEPVEVGHPTGHDELAIELDTTVAWHGADGAHVLIGGDGSIYRNPTDDASTDEFESYAPPAPPETSPYTVAELTPAGMDRIYERAAELGLTTSPAPEYDDSQTWTDQGTALLTIVTDEGPIEHRLYDPQAPDEEYDDERARLATFIEELTDVEALVGVDNVGTSEPYVPGQWIVTETWRPGDTAEWTFDTPPTEGCTELTTASDSDTATGDYADPSDADVAWKVTPAMPWDDC